MQLLRDLRAGDNGAIDVIFPVVYEELRHLAGVCLRRKYLRQTLQNTALVQEAYVRLLDGSEPDYRDRAYFTGIIVRIMRQMLVDYARGRNAAQQVGGPESTVDDSLDRPWIPSSMLDLDDALNRLESLDQQKACLIELRYFGGLSAEESACLLHIPVVSVRCQLRLAGAWLQREMDAVSGGECRRCSTTES